jgi:hypothetical protein
MPQGRRKNIEEETMQVRTIILLTALSVAPGLGNAQFDFSLGGRDI